MNISLGILEAEGELSREITSALVSFRAKISEEVNRNEDSRTKDHYDTSREGSEKVFHFRESLLSLKFEINDYKTLYNMMAASLLILTFTLCYDSYASKGTLIDMVAFMQFFRGWEKIFLVWWLLAIAHFSIILITFVALKTSKFVWIPLYLAHQSLLSYIGIGAVLNQPFGFATIIIGLAETVRMMMKSHSYFRTKMLYLTENEYKHINPLGPKAPK